MNWLVLHSLGEIEPRQIIQGVFLSSMAFSDDRFFNVFFSEIPIKLKGISTRKIMKNK